MMEVLAHETKQYHSEKRDFQYNGKTYTIEFVDLGLSSGTLWSTHNFFAEKVIDPGGEAYWYEYEFYPSYEQCKELIKECDFAPAFIQGKNGTYPCVAVTGPNGNTIHFPLYQSEEFECLAFDCWTRSAVGDSMARFMLIQTEPLVGQVFELNNITIGMSIRNVNRSVRFVLPK